MLRGWMLGIIVLFAMTTVFAVVMWLAFPGPSATPTKTIPAPSSAVSYTSQPVAQPYQPATPPLSPTIATNTPDGFAIAFYKWYLFEYANNLTNSQNQDFTQQLSQWLSPDYKLRFQSTAASPDDIDPILLASDWATSWPAHINAQIYSQTAFSAEIIVTLGTGSQTQKIHLSLVATDEGWRVSDVTPTA